MEPTFKWLALASNPHDVTPGPPQEGRGMRRTGQRTKQGVFQLQHVTCWSFITDGRTGGPTGDIDRY